MFRTSSVKRALVNHKSFHNQAVTPASPSVLYLLPSPWSPASPTLARGSCHKLAASPSTLADLASSGFKMSRTPTLTQGYFPWPSNVGLNIIMPDSELAAPLKSCLKGKKDRRQCSSLKLDLIPSTIPDDIWSFTDSPAPIDFSKIFNPAEPVKLRNVKDRLDTPRPQNDELEWLELQDEADLMRDDYYSNLNNIDMMSPAAVSPVLLSPATTPKLTAEKSRRSAASAAFRNFCSLPFTRSDPDGKLRNLDPFKRNKQQSNGVKPVQGGGETVIYETAPVPLRVALPFNSLSGLPITDIVRSISPKKFNASSLTPRRPGALSGPQWRRGAGGVLNGRFLTVYSQLGRSLALDAEDKFTSAML